VRFVVQEQGSFSLSRPDGENFLILVFALDARIFFDFRRFF
jgi:hypothetical protein